MARLDGFVTEHVWLDQIHSSICFQRPHQLLYYLLIFMQIHYEQENLDYRSKGLPRKLSGKKNYSTLQFDRSN
jgi:hypothetical protein